MWITMCKTIIRKCSDVDKYVEKFGSYPQLKNEIVEN